MALLSVDPSIAEDVILGASGVNPVMSPWRTYQVLVNGLPLQPRADGILADALRKALGTHLQEHYEAFVYVDDASTAFTPGVAIEPVECVGSPGRLRVEPGAPVLIEMPDRETYGKVWAESGDVGVPFQVRARANIRMAATGAKQALVWVVSDMGAVDEFRTLAFDEELATRLRAGMAGMAERVEREEEPDPEDGDMDTLISMLEGRPNSRRKAKPDDPVTKLVDEYQKAIEDRRPFNKQAEDLKKKIDDLKAKIQRALVECPEVELPDGRLVHCKVIHVKAKAAAAASSWVRLDVDKAPATAG